MDQKEVLERRDRRCNKTWITCEIDRGVGSLVRGAVTHKCYIYTVHRRTTSITSPFLLSSPALLFFQQQPFTPHIPNPIAAYNPNRHKRILVLLSHTHTHTHTTISTPQIRRRYPCRKQRHKHRSKCGYRKISGAVLNN